MRENFESSLPSLSADQIRDRLASETKPASHRRYVQSAPDLTALQKRIVAELNSHGVSLCHFVELFKNSELWSRLNWLVNRFSSSERVQSSIREGQREFSENQDLKPLRRM